MATWLEIQVAKTPAELQTELLANMQAAGLPVSSWTPGSRWHNLTLWFARCFSAIAGLILIVAKAAWLDTATDDALTDLAEGSYGTPRRIETFATGTVTILNNSGAPLDEDVDAISIEKNANTEITYKNSEAIYLLNGAQATFAFQCDIAGTTGNAIANGVSFVNALPGVTIVSSTAFVGQDQQSDADLRSLASKQASVLGTAHANKYEWIALNTNTDGTLAAANDGKTRCNVNRARVSFEDAEGRVSVVIAAPSGSADAGEATTVEASLTQYALTNPGVLLFANSVEVEVDITATITVRKGRSLDGIEEEVQARLDEYFPGTTIGGDDGFITIDELQLEMGRANANIHKVEISLPAADVALAEDEVAILGTVTLTVVNQV